MRDIAVPNTPIRSLLAPTMLNEARSTTLQPRGYGFDSRELRPLKLTEVIDSLGLPN